MKPTEFLADLSVALEVTSEDLAQVRADVGTVKDVIEGSSLWATLGHCHHRLDVHIRSLLSIAERARRLGESLKTLTEPPR